MDVIARLNGFYCPPEKNNDFADENYGLGDLPAELLEQATDVLFMLETIEWKWDINTLLDQPHDLFKAVLRLMVAGNKLQAQNKKPDLPIEE